MSLPQSEFKIPAKEAGHYYRMLIAVELIYTKEVFRTTAGSKGWSTGIQKMLTVKSMGWEKIRLGG